MNKSIVVLLVLIWNLVLVYGYFYIIDELIDINNWWSVPTSIIIAFLFFFLALCSWGLIPDNKKKKKVAKRSKNE